MKIMKLLLRNLFLNFLILLQCRRLYGYGQRASTRSFESNACRTPLDDLGSCVSLKFCPEILTLFSKLSLDAAKQYSLRLQRICGNRVTSDNYPVVCCTLVSSTDISMSRGTTTSTTTTTTTTPMSPTQGLLHCERHLANCTQSSGATECCPAERDHNTSPSSREAVVHQLPSEEEGCGLVNVTLPKIVGGEESQIGAWPWMALIGYDPYSVKPFRCGGTLVSAKHVITAAHCIRHDLSFVRLGEFDLSVESETRHVDINVIKHAKHHEYGRNRRSDVAILLLERNVQFTELIAPICMPNSIQLRSRSYIDTVPYVAGWGYTMQGGSPSHVLKQAQLPIQKNDVCQRIYRQLVPSLPPEDFDESIFCVGYTIGGADTCQGDSGGPLMIPELYKGITRYYLIGIVSYGHGCGKVPGIYINVQKKMDWIVQQVQEM